MTNYTKISFSVLFVAFLAYAVAIAPAFAIELQDNGDTSAPATQDNGTTAAPATQDNGTTADSSAPATQDNGSTSAPATQDNGTTAAPATQDNGTTADSSAPATQDNGTTADNSGNNNPSNPGNDNNNSGGGSGRSRSARTTTASTTLPTTDDLGNCAYITTYMKIDALNTSSEVTKLQSFLKNTEGADVDVNGNFDAKTFEAVKAFQSKYASEILAPWGATAPTGYVFYTTQKKINEIFCKTTFTLTAEQLAAIEAYKNRPTDVTSTEVDGTTATSTDTVSPEIGSNGGFGQTASAFLTTIGSKITSFFKWLFGIDN